jgi:hypothetical protein
MAARISDCCIHPARQAVPLINSCHGCASAGLLTGVSGRSTCKVSTPGSARGRSWRVIAAPLKRPLRQFIRNNILSRRTHTSRFTTASWPPSLVGLLWPPAHARADHGAESDVGAGHCRRGRWPAEGTLAGSPWCAYSFHQNWPQGAHHQRGGVSSPLTAPGAPPCSRCRGSGR